MSEQEWWVVASDSGLEVEVTEVVEVRRDVLTDGRPCYVARAWDYPGMFAYDRDAEVAERLLREMMDNPDITDNWS